jgi:hypothetical protein
VLAFVLSLFGARLVQLQGPGRPDVRGRGRAGRLRTVTLPAARGTITDRNGIALATTVAAVNVTSDQTKVVDPAATAAVLAPVLNVDPTVLQEKLTGDARFVYLAKAVTPATWRKISTLDHPDPDIAGLPGIYAEQTSKRVYPAGSVGSNIVGFVGADGKGLGGIEYALDSTLAGRDGTATYELSAGGRRIPSGVDTERDAVPGTDVRLTLDRDIQYVAQKAIAKAVASSQAQSGTVVVYDPKSGDLLAVATAPSFDPNDPGAAPAEDRGDRPLNEAYEPGSTGKIITASALIQEGVITPTTPIVVPNRLYRAGKSFKDFEEHGVEHLTYTGTIAKSSNIGTIKAAERLGQPQAALPLPEEVRRRRADRARAAGRAVRRDPEARRLVGYQWLHDDLRAGLLRQRGADGRGVRDRGERRGPRVAAAGRVDHRAERRGAPDAGLEADPGHHAADRPDRPADDGDGARGRRHRAAGADPRLPGRWQDRHRAAVRPGLRLLPRQHPVVHRACPGRRPGRGRGGHPAGAQGRHRRRLPGRSRCSSRWPRSRSSRCGSRRPGPSRPA